MTGEIEKLISELPLASDQRVEEIVTILESVLSDIECKLPTEDDTDSAYECQNIPKAQELIALVRAWNVRGKEVNESDIKRQGRESGIKMINKLSKELQTTFNQICLVSIDAG